MKSILLSLCTVIALPLFSLAEFEVLISPTPESTERQFIWRVDPGRWYRLQSTTNLLSTWGTAQEFQAGGPVFVHDKGATEAGFYRLMRIDVCPPKMLSYYPYDGAYSVPRFSQVRIALADESGINPDSISLTVGTNGTFTLADAKLNLVTNQLIFSPMGVPLGDYGEVIDMTLNVADTNDNSLAFTWSAELEYRDIPVSNLFVFGSPGAFALGQELSSVELEFARTSGMQYPTENLPPVKWRIQSVGTNEIVLHVDDQPTMDLLSSILLPGRPIANAAVDNVAEFFYRRIISVDVLPPLMTLETEWVPLEALFESYSYRLDPNSAVHYVTDDTGNISFPPPAPVPTTTLELFDFDRSYDLVDRTWDWSDEVFSFGDGDVSLSFTRLDLSIESSAEVAGKFTLSTSSSRREMEFSAALTTTFDAGVLPVFDVTVSEHFENSGSIVDEFTLLDWTVWIGSVPLPFELNFGTTWEAYADGELNATVTGGFTFNKTTTYWAEYDYYRSTRFQSGKSVSGPGLEFVEITATAEGSLDAGVSVIPYLELAVGPSVTILSAEVEAQAGVRGQIRAYGDLTVDVIASTHELPFGHDLAPASIDGYDMRASLTAGISWEILAFYSLVLDAPWPFNSLDMRRSDEIEVVSGELIDPIVEYWRINTVEEPSIGDIREYIAGAITDPFIPASRSTPDLGGLPGKSTLQRTSAIVTPSVVVTNSGGTVESFDGGYATQWYVDGIPIPGMTNRTLYFESPAGKVDGNYTTVVSGSGTQMTSPDARFVSIPEASALESPVAAVSSQLLTGGTFAAKPLAAAGMWNGTNALFLPLLSGDVNVHDEDGALVKTMTTGFPAVDHIDCGDPDDTNGLVLASGGAIKLYDQHGNLTNSYSGIGNITYLAMDADYLALATTAGAGPTATTTCVIIDLLAANPFAAPLVLDVPSGGTLFTGSVSLDYNHPLLLVGVREDGETHLYNVSEARANPERIKALDTYGGVTGIPDKMGTQVHLTGEYALVKGTGSRHWLYHLQGGALALEWNAAAGTSYYPCGIRNALVGLGDGGACSLFNVTDGSITGTTTIDVVSPTATAQNLVSNQGFDLSVARFDDSGPVTVKTPLLMLLEEMDPPGCP